MIDFAAIKHAALQRALQLLREWLPNGHLEGDEYVACNPTRADNNPGSFKVNLKTGAWSDFATNDKGGDLISLFAYLRNMSQGNAARELGARLGLNGDGREILTLQELADAKGLPVEFLKEHGLVQRPDGVLIQFFNLDGTLASRHQKRVRLTDEFYLDKTEKRRKLSRFFWTGPKGSGGILPYGLETLLPPRSRRLFVVEGPTDRLTGLYHQLDVLALPGASTAKLIRGEHVLLFDEIVAVLEPDRGGETLRTHLPEHLGVLKYPGKLRALNMPEEVKDLNGLHLKTLGDPGGFEAELEELLKQGEELPISVKGSDTEGSEAFSADQITDKEPDPPAKYSDIALSNRLADLYGNDLRYVKQLREWFVYSEQESRWAEDEKMFPWTLAKRMLTAVADEAYDKVMSSDKPDASKATKLASAIASASKVAAVVTLARSHKRIAATMGQFDRDPWLLNTPGGVVNLKDGTIRPAKRADYFTKITAIAPRRMPTPVFNQFILDIMGEQISPTMCSCAACSKSSGEADAERLKAHKAEVRELKDYILRIYGYALTGDVREHILVFEIGEGGNGKGVLNDLVSEDIMGTYPIGYACNVPIEALLVSRGERHPTELMDLWNSRLALARESDEDTRWNEGRVKWLTGGDRIKARRMRQDFVEFPPTHKLIVFGNSKPTLRGADQSAWKRRLHMIIFRQKYADQPDESKNILKADKELRDRLRAEAPGILQILIDQCLERQRLKGFSMPQTVREATDQYLDEQNTLAQWMAERCDTSNPNETTTANELWADWSTWAEGRKEYIGKRKEFNDRVERAGIRITRTGTQRGICRGINLRANAQ